MPHLQPTQLITLTDHILYWNQCMSTIKEIDERKVAYDMVQIMHSEKHAFYYGDEGCVQGDPDYAEVWELAVALETPDGTKEERSELWKKIGLRLQILNERYVALTAPMNQWSEA